MIREILSKNPQGLTLSQLSVKSGKPFKMVKKSIEKLPHEKYEDKYFLVQSPEHRQELRQKFGINDLIQEKTFKTKPTSSAIAGSVVKNQNADKQKIKTLEANMVTDNVTSKVEQVKSSESIKADPVKTEFIHTKTDNDLTKTKSLPPVKTTKPKEEKLMAVKVVTTKTTTAINQSINPGDGNKKTNITTRPLINGLSENKISGVQELCEEVDGFSGFKITLQRKSSGRSFMINKEEAKKLIELLSVFK